MKIFKTIFILFFGLYHFAIADKPAEKINQDTLGHYFSDYFGKHKFKVIKNGMDVGGERIYLAVQYVPQKDSREPVFKNGIAVGIEDSQITPLLYFENNLILGRNRKTIVDLRPHHHKCYGWLFNVPRKKPEEIYHNGFSINVAWVYDENHLNTAQDPPISIKWDKKKKCFFDWVYEGD